MKIFWTIEFIAALLFVIAWGRDVANRSNYHTNDGGWTTYYTYKTKIREQAYKMSYIGLGVAIIGGLIFIWS